MVTGLAIKTRVQVCEIKFDTTDSSHAVALTLCITYNKLKISITIDCRLKGLYYPMRNVNSGQVLCFLQRRFLHRFIFVDCASLVRLNHPHGFASQRIHLVGG